MLKSGNISYLRSSIRESFKKDMKNIDKKFFKSHIFKRFEVGYIYKYIEDYKIIRQYNTDYDCVCLQEELNEYQCSETMFYAVEMLENAGFHIDKVRVNDINIFRSYFRNYINKE